MIPDFPRLKEEMDATLTRILRQRVQFHEGEAISDVPHHTLHEGDENAIIRPDGKEDGTEIVQHGHELAIPWKEFALADLRQVLFRLEEVAKDMASQKSKYFFEMLNKVTTETGNVIDGKGKPLSADALLSVLEKIQADFDETGNLSGLRMVVAPSQRGAAEEAMRQIGTDPQLKKKHAAILMKKKEEWRAREAARTLVG